MRSEREVRERIAALEDVYDAHDPPSSSMEDDLEIAVLRAIEELEWVVDEREEPPSFSE